MARNRHKSSSRKKAKQTSDAAKPAAERAPASAKPAAGISSKRGVWIAAGVAAAIVLGAGLLYALYGSPAKPPQSASIPVQALSFVGSDTCASCHGGEAKLWHGSQHAHAMAHATKDTVLGDFNDASFDYFGVHSRFFRDGDKFMVETDGPDGKLAAFEVKYTFGLDPLQQYLVEFPDGRIQALSLSWDSRPKDQGGQRWFHLYPHEEIRHDDILHWTKLNQNWNFMCAECHSTGVRKNYDAAKDRFATRWTEISVGCEACHGQGSAHVAWAKDQKSWWPYKSEDPDKGLLVRFDERSGVTWGHDAKTGFPVRSASPAGVAQGGRDLRALPCASGTGLRRLGARTAAFRHASRRCALPRALPARRADAR